MARSNIPVTEILLTGVTPPAQTTADAANDHYINASDLSDGTLFIEVVSSDAGSQTVDVVANPDLTLDGLTVSDLSVTVGAGVTKLIGPFRLRTFKQALDSNRIYINPSVSTTLKFRAYKLTPAR